MGFYYLNLGTLLFLAIVYSVAILVLWVIWAKGLGLAFKGPVVWALIVVILIAPWLEEFWVAYQFGQACKDAGTFIYKKVRVEGFYDSTMRSAYENTRSGGYQFVEHQSADHGAVERVERADDTLRAKALAWYLEHNPGQSLPKDKAVIFPITDRERIAVFPNGADARRITTLDHPSARYQYSWPFKDVAIGHKIFKRGEEVRDIQTGEILGRSVEVGRSSPWFFLALDDPGLSCPKPSEQPGVLLYRLVLEPMAIQKGG